MKIIPTHISGVLVLEPLIFEEDRGFYYESFNRKFFEERLGWRGEIAHDRHSRSARNVLRGLHYQANKQQNILVEVVAGEIYQVIVDLRKSSPTCGKWVGIHSSAVDRRLVWIPTGFAHGFLILTEFAEFVSRFSEFSDPQSDRCIRWDDPDLSIPWPLEGHPIVSASDRSGKSFRQAEMFS